MKNINQLKFRASSIGHLMTEPRSKAAKESGELSETAKTHCIDVFASWYYGRHEEISTKYMEKGNEVEEDSITLLCSQTKKFYTKNEQKYENEYIAGTPDLFVLKDRNIEVVEDIKSSWSLHTFLRQKNSELPSNYYYQVMAYMALTGAKSANVRYCLVNAPATLIDDEKRRLTWKYAEGSDEYLRRAKQIEINMIFDLQGFKNTYPFYILDNEESAEIFDIPAKHRYFTYPVERSDEVINQMYSKVIRARLFIEQNLLP